VISQTAEYALRAIVCIAANGDRPITTQQIAEAARVPASYLSKVLQMLGRAGLVRAQRGLHGGFTMTRAPAETSVLDIVNAIEPLQRIRGCPLHLEEHSHRLCALHHRLDQAMADIEAALSQATIAEILAVTDRDSACALGRVEREDA